MTNTDDDSSTTHPAPNEPTAAPLSQQTPNKTRVPPTLVEVGNGAIAIWHRPKLRILRLMKADGLTTVVTLLTESEGAPHIGRAALAAELEWVWVPMQGAGIPEQEQQDAIVAQLAYVAACIDNGARVLIHCSAGIHRTGMFTYALLRYMGIDTQSARQTLSRLRSVTGEGVGESRLAWGDSIARPNPL